MNTFSKKRRFNQCSIFRFRNSSGKASAVENELSDEPVKEEESERSPIGAATATGTTTITTTAGNSLVNNVSNKKAVDSPWSEVKNRNNRNTNRRSSSLKLKLPNGLRLNLTESNTGNSDKNSHNSQHLRRHQDEATRIEIIEEQQPLVGGVNKVTSNSKQDQSFQANNINYGYPSGAGVFFASDDDYIDDYITPEMNYKDGLNSSTCRKSPPIIHTHDGGSGGGVWDKHNSQQEADNISLYGTPKEEMIPGLGDTKGPSFMRSQIEALFQPSGKTSMQAKTE